MIGLRKTILTLAGLIVFAFVCAKTDGPIDYMTLGLGIGMLLTPAAVGNIFEHKYKK